MLIQKIFHIHHSLEETKARLKDLPSMRNHLPGAQKLIVTDDDVAQFEFFPTATYSVHGVVVRLPSEQEDQVLFKSTAGNVEVQGLIEFSAVRQNVTEVQLILNYKLTSPWRRLMDFCTRDVEHYIERRLRDLQSSLNGARISRPIRTVKSPNPVAAGLFGRVPQFAS